MAAWNSPVLRRQSARSSARFRSEGSETVKGVEPGGRFGDLKRFVVGQCQVELEPRRHVRRRDVQSSPVFIDGLLVAA